MIRLFVENLSEASVSIALDKEQSHYLSKVLRLSVGDALIIFDGSGKEYICSVTGLKDRVALRVRDIRESEIKASKDITLFQGLLKGKKMDLVIQKTAEIGIRAIVPVISERTQIRRTSKGDRWRKIAHEASRQCGRSDIIGIKDTVSFDDLKKNVVPHYEDAMKIVFYEKGIEPIHKIEERIQRADRIVLFTGPEGGFSDREVQSLLDSNFYISGLGDYILRAETAAIVASGIIQYICNKPV
jgi:16S rRNA (uracil1498-N3)-methyltransferase